MVPSEEGRLMNFEHPPQGFQVNQSHGNELELQYRRLWSLGATIHQFVWLAGWTVGCVWFTWHALFAPSETAWKMDGMLVFAIFSFWVAEIGTIVAVLWHYFSTTRFVLKDQELVVERTFLSHVSRRAFRKDAILNVKLAPSGDEGFPSWNLLLMGSEESKVLTRQPRDQSEWLGRTLASWAGVAFETDYKS